MDAITDKICCRKVILALVIYTISTCEICLLCAPIKITK